MLFTFSLVCFAQNPSVDENFTPALSKVSSSIAVRSEIQPDGKIIVFGPFNVVNGYIRYNVARLNTDGTTDTTFNCVVCTFIISNALPQPDGKILVAGRESVSQPYEKIIRVNSDGSLDSTFNYTRLSGNQPGIYTVKGVQSDGKILVVNRSNFSDYLYRLNPDGSLDNSFTTFVSQQQYDVKILPDGRIFLFGNTHFGYLAMLNSDGTKSSAFQSPSLASNSGDSVIYDIALQTDGKLLISGRFTSVNGLARDGLARLNTDQSVDTTFVPAIPNPSPFGVGRIFSLSNNKVLVTNATVPGKIYRLNSDGSLDNTFTTISVTNLYSIQIDSSERIYVSKGTFVRYNSDGSLDASFNPVTDVSGLVSGLGLQPDGKILVGGNYQKANGLNRRTVSRLNADGSTDTSFDTASRFADSATVFDFGVQTDGKILVGGYFLYDGVPRRLVRLNSDGSLDTPFDVSFNGNPNSDTSVLDISMLPDGKILIGGSFTAVNGVTRSSLARLNSDGTTDTAFNVQLGTNALVFAAVVQTDGKIMIGGRFSGVNGINRPNLARLNSDGTLDTSFNATVEQLNNLVIQPDGKYLAVSNQRLYRLNSDGSPDSGFTSPGLSTGGSFTDLAVLNDGSIIVSGVFTSLNGISLQNIARLKPNGTPVSNAFTIGTDSPPSVFLKQPDGKLLAGGDFKLMENKPRTGLARLTFSSVVGSTPFDYDGDGRADISVFRPSSNVWYQLVGANYQFTSRSYGSNGDIIVPADFDGDGKTDFAVFRPSTGDWHYIGSRNNFPSVRHWGQAGDIPLPSDVNGDGTADFVVYRPSSSNWFRLTTTGVFTEIVFGTNGDKPLIGDFDGDGKADPAIYRPSTGTWWYAASSAGNAFRAVQWGISEDIPVAQDFDGDGKTDYAVFRPSNGVWYILNSGSITATIIQFGLTNDKPIAADYDGDGKADIAVYRPSTGEWYLLRSTAGFTGFQFGISEDIPIPNAFIR